MPNDADVANASEDDANSKDPSAESSNPPSREGSRHAKRKQNVRFTPGGESLDTSNQRAAFDLRDDTNAPPKPKPIRRRSSVISRGNERGPSSLRTSSKERSEDIADETARAPVPKVRPSIRRLPSSNSSLVKTSNGMGGKRKQKEEEATMDNQDEGQDDDEDEDAPAKAESQKSAQDRAERLSRMVGTHSAPGSRYASPHRPSNGVIRSPPPSPPPEAGGDMPIDLNDIPLEKLQTKRTKYGIEDDSEEEEEDVKQKSGKRKKRENSLFQGAARLLRSNRGPLSKQSTGRAESPEPPSGAQTPISERDPEHYVPRPAQYREGYLSSLLKLYDREGWGSAISHIPSGPAGAARAARRSSSSLPLLGLDGSPDFAPETPTITPGGSPTSSGTSTPRPKPQKWYHNRPTNHSTGALVDFVTSSTILAQPGGASRSGAVRPKQNQKMHRKHRHHNNPLGHGKKRRVKLDDEMTIEIRMTETMERQSYLLAMCRALMIFGAPTHRLEEYMRMSARALDIDGQFLYLPGCMIVSFDDNMTQTTQVKIVRTSQGVDLGKLQDVHDIYKQVIHDIIGVQEAIERLRGVTNKRSRYTRWTIVFLYGLTSLCVGPFAFGARPIDLPMAFVLGCLLGFMQLILAPRSDLYKNVFEICASIITSFLARALGSINNGELFCFSALTQSSIALILPGYTVLCASLELQSRNVIAGSVRMVWAIIYSLFLGFGITIGTSIYGGMSKYANSDTSCRNAMPLWFSFIFVPPFTLCVIIINQAKWRQVPVMISIAFVGYVVNYYSSIRFASNVQIANALGAFVVGVLGNCYSRWRHGLAVTALLPAIYVQVPSGLAASGSLVSGIATADMITNHGNTSTSGRTTISSATDAGASINPMMFNVGYSMIQVAIGITVGLFMSAVVVYPFGKRRSGLFSF